MSTGRRREGLAIAALFAALGFQYSSWASRLPAFADRLGLNPAEVGVLLLATGAGAAVAFPLVPTLLRRLGTRRLALGAAVVLAAALPAMAGAPTFPALLAVMVVDGVAVAGLNVAMNAQGAAWEVRHGATVMARLHAVFSGGALLAALLASGISALDPGLLTHLVVATAVLLVLIGVAATGPAAPEPPAADPQAPRPARRRFTLRSAVTAWLAAAMVAGTVTEGAMTDWSALYLATVVLAAPAIVPLGIAVYSTTMVAARLCADGWRTRFGDGPVVIVGSLLAGLGLGVALLVGGVVPALLGFACVGLGIAAVTPCVYVAAARRGADDLTVVAATGTVGLLAGPPLIGFLAGATSLVWGLGVVALCAVLVAGCATRIPWPDRARPERTPAGP